MIAPYLIHYFCDLAWRCSSCKNNELCAGFITHRRLDFIQEMNEKEDGYNALPEETTLMIQRVILELSKMK